MKTFLPALLALVACARLGAAQTDTSATRSPLEVFRALEPEQRSSIARGLRRRLQRDSDPDVQRLLDYGLRFRTLPLAKPPVAHRAKDWAKGVAKERTLVRKGSAAWKRVAARYPEVPLLPRLQRHVRYDWGSGKIERTREERISDDALFENLLAGYAPGSGDAFVSILATLDEGPKDAGAYAERLKTRRAVAAWAEHLYADLDAKVYEGIRFWRAWHATELVDVPDVDAIPFAKHVFGETWKSPIPANAARTQLYDRMQKKMLAYRIDRELREVAAATWLHAAPRFDRQLRRLVHRMHQVWAECDDDPVKMAARLARVRNRDAFLKELDDAAGKSAAVYEKREGRRRRLARLAARLRDMARATLR